MASEKMNAVLQKEVEGKIVDLMLQTTGENVLLDNGKTLAQFVAEQVTGITQEQMNAAIKAAVDTAIEKLIDGAPEALDTLKEIADWIENHEDLYEGLLSKINASGRILHGTEIPEDFTPNDLFIKILS